MNIAVFLDKNGRVLPFIAAGVVEMYSDESGSWNCINQIPFELSTSLGINDIRVRTKLLVAEFGACEIVVIESIKGIAKVVLEEFNVGTWQFSGQFQFQLLDAIKETLLRIKLVQEKQVQTPVPIGDSSQGLYEINVATLLENDNLLNSRDLLIPFLKKTHFRQLTIVCNHLPKWFEQAVVLLHLNYETTQTVDGQCCIVVKPINYDAGIAHRKNLSASALGDLGGCSSGCCSSGIC